MKKFIISAFAILLAFTGIHAQTASTTDTTKKVMHKTHMKGKHKAGHAMHHKTGMTKQKAKSTTGGASTTPQQKPVAATTPSTTTPATAKAATGAKGAHYAVNSNGKKTYIKSAHSK